MKDFLWIKDEGHRIKDKIEYTLKLKDEGNTSFILDLVSLILNSLSFIFYLIGLIATVALWPPKPRELEIAMSIGCSSACSGV